MNGSERGLDRNPSIKLQRFAEGQIVRLPLPNTAEIETSYANYEIVEDSSDTVSPDDLITLGIIGGSQTFEVTRSVLSRQNSNSIPPQKYFNNPDKPNNRQDQPMELAVVESLKEPRFKAGDKVVLGGFKRRDQVVCEVLSDEGDSVRIKTPNGDVVSVKQSEVRLPSEPPADVSVAK